MSDGSSRARGAAIAVIAVGLLAAVAFFATRPEERMRAPAEPASPRSRMMVWDVGRPGLAARNVVWASRVVERSSERSPGAAHQALGLPDVYPASGEDPRAWCARRADGGAEHLTVRFPGSVHASAIAIVETEGAGALVRVDDATNEPMVLWEGLTAPYAGARILSVELPSARVMDAVTLVLDTRRVAGCNAVDAIGLVPERPPPR